MPFMLCGVNTTLTASGSGTIRIRPPVGGRINRIMVNSTGRAKITNFEVTGVKDFWEGEIEIEQLKEYGNVFHLTEPIEFTKGSDINISLTDLSGSSNAVYIAVEILY